ncbi:protein kinase [Streptomyces sp. NPDC002888]|uniref:protein kinase domain-containing protein n=1 Tax=Streptomyces sp. NPDC002888 TaxID=3364668 RepID=UPI0036AE2CEB
MGRVWRAVDEILDRLVAVKEMRIDGLDAEDTRTRRERALREARATARIDHPNVVRVYDVVDEGERLWIVMELVHGRSLERIMAEEGPLGPPETARIGLELVAALREVHAGGVLHRDIKPGNVLVESAGRRRVVLTDFGIAAIEDTTALTMVGMLVGSPDYMAPERVSGRPQGPPSDLWSLGATLCAALAGHSPFSRDTTLATLHAVLYEEPELPETAGPLRPLLTTLLKKTPSSRPALADLESALRSVAFPTPTPTLVVDGAEVTGGGGGAGSGGVRGNEGEAGGPGAAAVEGPGPGPGPVTGGPGESGVAAAGSGAAVGELGVAAAGVGGAGGEPGAVAGELGVAAAEPGAVAGESGTVAAEPAESVAEPEPPQDAVPEAAAAVQPSSAGEPGAADASEPAQSPEPLQDAVPPPRSTPDEAKTPTGRAAGREPVARAAGERPTDQGVGGERAGQVGDWSPSARAADAGSVAHDADGERAGQIVDWNPAARAIHQEPVGQGTVGEAVGQAAVQERGAQAAERAAPTHYSAVGEHTAAVAQAADPEPASGSSNGLAASVSTEAVASASTEAASEARSEFASEPPAGGFTTAAPEACSDAAAGGATAVPEACPDASAGGATVVPEPRSGTPADGFAKAAPEARSETLPGTFAAPAPAPRSDAPVGSSAAVLPEVRSEPLSGSSAGGASEVRSEPLADSSAGGVSEPRSEPRAGDSPGAPDPRSAVRADAPTASAQPPPPPRRSPGVSLSRAQAVTEERPTPGPRPTLEIRRTSTPRPTPRPHGAAATAGVPVGELPGPAVPVEELPGPAVPVGPTALTPTPARNRRRTALFAAAGVLTAGAVVAVVLASASGTPDGTRAGPTQSTAPSVVSSGPDSPLSSTPSTTTPSSTVEGTSRPPILPPGAHPEAGGYAWVTPKGWRRDVKTGAEVHYTSPDGKQELVAKSSLARGDLMETWKTSEENAHQGQAYRKIRLEETTFQGHPAVVWEYTFTLQGTPWHARLLGFNANGKSYQINTWYQPTVEPEALRTYDRVKDSFTLI